MTARGQPTRPRRRRSGPAAALLAVLALTGAACGGDGPGTAGDDPPDPRTSTSTSPSTSTSSDATPSTPVPGDVRACAGRDVEGLQGVDRRVALTFDMGGDSAGLRSILRTLAAERVRATFFVTGTWARRDPDGLRAIAGAGHLVGNHTDTHPELPTKTAAEVRTELAAAEEVVRATIGRSTRPLFRFPFGARDASTLAVVNAEGYCAYRWTVDTLGWKGTSGGTTAQVVVDRVLRTLRPGQIVLMHGGANPEDASTLDADALPQIVRAVRARGYGFTTLPSG